MSLILRILFVLAGLIAALFVTRDGTYFALVHIWFAIGLVFVMAISSGRLVLRRKA